MRCQITATLPPPHGLLLRARERVLLDLRAKSRQRRYPDDPSALRRYGTPEQAARISVWLAPHTFVTGKVIAANGGI
jgi:NAD(P)-dependent dehydrogenase (short-subunit alcohol dehydrogenase family)